MTRRTTLLISIAFLSATGCQTGQTSLPWFSSNDPVYTEQQVASMDYSTTSGANPVEPQLAGGVTATPVSSSNNAAMVASTNPQVEQLVQSGRATIRQADAAGASPSTTSATVAISCDGGLEREVAAGLIGVAVGMLPTVIRGVCRLLGAAVRRLRGPGEEEEKEEEESQEQEKEEQDEEEETGRKRKRIRMEV